jgi:hypothetical protein
MISAAARLGCRTPVSERDARVTRFKKDSGCICLALHPPGLTMDPPGGIETADPKMGREDEIECGVRLDIHAHIGHKMEVILTPQELQELTQREASRLAGARARSHSGALQAQARWHADRDALTC